MATLNAKAGDAMKDLGKLVDPAARPQLAAATDALDRFDGISKKIVALSRHNSNVRSLELSIRRKPAITAVCDESLRTLQDALAKETFKATR
jgi:glutamine synthetase